MGYFLFRKIKMEYPKFIIEHYKYYGVEDHWFVYLDLGVDDYQLIGNDLSSEEEAILFMKSIKDAAFEIRHDTSDYLDQS